MTAKLGRYAIACMFAVSGVFATRGEASVVIGGTRVVYPSQDKEVTIKLKNEGKRPALVQVWMDRGDENSTPDAAKVPFTIMPPIFRMEPDKGQAVRVLYTKEPLPTDKETMFWFNVLEVPPRTSNQDGQNLLQFAIRTRIKFLFRPSGLPGSAADAFDQLSWRLVKGGDGKGVALQVNNPTAYYVNFARVGVKAGGHSYMEKSGGMVAPGGSSTFQISGIDGSLASGARAQFDVINDYGAIGSHEKPISP
jgi:chaperone protein EcpD